MPTLKKFKNPHKRKKDRAPTSDQPFYRTKQWLDLRQLQLQSFPCCEAHERAGLYVDCTSGGHIDHIVPMSKGGSPSDLRNLMTLCKPCHDYKTILERYRDLLDPSGRPGEHYASPEEKHKVIQLLASVL